MFIALCKEYTFRYKKIHATQKKLETILKDHPFNIPVGDLTEFFQCMPDDSKAKDPIQGYRKFYNIHKSSFAQWKTREVPEWFDAK